MLAFQVQKGKLRSREKPAPKLRPGWALVRVRLAGICNTDVEILRGYHAFRGTPGHEFVAEVADVHGDSAAEKKKWLRLLAFRRARGKNGWGDGFVGRLMLRARVMGSNQFANFAGGD